MKVITRSPKDEAARGTIGRVGGRLSKRMKEAVRQRTRAEGKIEQEMEEEKKVDNEQGREEGESKRRKIEMRHKADERGSKRTTCRDGERELRGRKGQVREEGTGGEQGG